MANASGSISYQSLLGGTVADAWDRCIPVWRPRGRIEDLPRDVFRASYTPSQEKWLGEAFSERFRDQCDFVIEKLRSGDPVEVACAHDLLVMMARWEANQAAIWAIRRPIMNWVRRELDNLPLEYETFRGTTLGELFRFEQEA